MLTHQHGLRAGDDDSAATVADAIVAATLRHGIDTIFGYPGESSLPLYDAVARSNARHVMARCERCAGFMADGYARAKGSVGVVDTPGGVGTPWLVPALHESFTSAVPVVALVTSAPDRAVGRWPTTHCDNAALFSSVSKAVLPLRVAQRTDELVDRAFALAVAGRPGPVVIDIEPELLRSPAEPARDRASARTTWAPRQRPRPDAALLTAVADTVRAAQRPLLVVGGGVHSSAAYEHVRSLVECTRLPLVTTFNGKGALPEDHGGWRGVVGAKGMPDANALAAEADLTIWAGSKGGDKSTQYGALPAPGGITVQVDLDPEALGRTFDAELVVQADLGSFCTDLEAALDGWRAPAWTRATNVEPAAGWGGAHIVAGLRTGRHPLRIVADASKASSWAGAYDRTPGGARWTWAPRGSGTLGYALPAAIGAAYATPSEPVIAIAGDAGASMASHELETAVRSGLNLLVIVLDNASLGLIEDVGRHTFGDGFALPDRPSVSWAELAQVYGLRASRVGGKEELEAAVADWYETGGPALVQARLPRAEVSPDLAMFIQSGARSW